MKSGRCIVIEGTDGSGKGTQFELLRSYFQEHAIPHETFDFPQYDQSFFGSFVGKFLSGEFGPHTDIPPYLIAIPYAADRWQAKERMVSALAEGKIVLINRYAASNAAYQAAKLPEKDREACIRWIFEMEYDTFGIPREDIVCFLHVPTDVSQNWITQKDQRSYLENGRTKDVHEEDVQLQREVEKTYLWLCKMYPNWVTIDCVQNGAILSKETIHEKIVSMLKDKSIL